MVKHVPLIILTITSTPIASLAIEAASWNGTVSSDSGRAATVTYFNSGNDTGHHGEQSLLQIVSDTSIDTSLLVQEIGERLKTCRDQDGCSGDRFQIL